MEEEPTARELWEQVTRPPPDLEDMYIDWAKFWTHDLTAAEWLAEPIIPAHRSVAMFARGGTGKSLLALWIAAALATGRPIFGTARPPVEVLYLDWEMTEADLQQRLDAMGYGPDDDLSHLHYALQPPLPPLDERDGGDDIIRRAAALDVELVVVDTFGRAVRGDENDADTVRAWYRWTGQRLKADGRAFLRIDHAGKDMARGQRGSSAKNDDVDIVWHLTILDGDVVRLRAIKKRMQWVPDVVELQREEDDMTYKLLVGMRTYSAGTKELADLLDDLGTPIEVSRRDAAAELRTAGHKVRNATLGDAIAYRKEHALTWGPVAGTNLSTGSGTTGGDHQGPTDKTPAQSMGTTSGDQWGPVADVNGDHPVPPIGGQGYPTCPERPDPGVFG